MFALTGVWLSLLAADAPYACKETCLNHLSDGRLRATVCGRCFTHADRGQWAAGLGGEAAASQRELEGLLTDADWAVRWGGVRALAQRKARPEAQVLSEWVLAVPEPGCATWVHAVGAKKANAPALSPAATAACTAHRARTIEALQLEMVSPLSTLRVEAATHLAVHLGQPVGRVVLDALATRPEAADALSAELLLEAGRRLGSPGGLLLMAAPLHDGDEKRVNRVLAVWSRQIDALRPQLGAKEKEVRREAISRLAELAPASSAELQAALDDADLSNRRAAARALAAGAGQSLVAYARQQIRSTADAAPQKRLRWVAFIGSSQDPACGAALRDLYADGQNDEQVRGACLPALTDCEGPKAMEVVHRALASGSARLRSHAVLALSNLPRLPEALRQLELALKDSDPQVLSAAARTAATLKPPTAAGRLIELLRHSDAEVRIEAVRALAALETPVAVGAVTKQLQTDAAPGVRAAAAAALGELRVASALPVLIDVAEHDADQQVKFEATESLRKLGFRLQTQEQRP